jgi:hypothetical protein
MSHPAILLRIHRFHEEETAGRWLRQENFADRGKFDKAKIEGVKIYVFTLITFI